MTIIIYIILKSNIIYIKLACMKVLLTDNEINNFS